MKLLWVMFIAGQILSAGNMNYQQELGYREINPIYNIYHNHPTKAEVYATKAAEIALVYVATKALPEHEKIILTGANLFCWGFIARDKVVGIKFGLRW